MAAEMPAPARPWEAHYPAAVPWDAALDPRPLYDFLDRAAAEHGERRFLDFLGRRFRYAEIAELATRAAAGFRAQGVGPGVHVGLHLPNTPHYVICFFAVLRAGGVVVNFSPLLAEAELARQIADSEVRVMVTLDAGGLYERLARVLPEAGLDRVVVCALAEMLPAPKALLLRTLGRGRLARVPRDDVHLPFAELLASGGPAPEVPSPELGALAVLQYTGGTTGTPKGAMHSHASLSVAALQAALWCGQAEVGGGEKVLGALPLFHCFGLGLVLLVGMHFGAEIVLHPRFEADRVLRDLRRKRITVFPGVPIMFAAVAEHPRARRRDLATLKLCLSGGAPLPAAVERRFRALTDAHLVEGYGLSESAAVACCTPLEGERRPGSVGLPLPGTVVEIRDLDAPERVLGPGAAGEVCLRGPQLMAGYWKRPEETAAQLSAGILRTGDVGYLDADGHLHLVDRIKDVVISGGFNVYPRVVEEAILEHPTVLEAAVIGVPDPRRGEAAKAFVVVAPGAALSLEELRDFLASRLGRHELPAALEVRASLPHTPIGKPDKKALREAEKGQSGGSDPHASTGSA